MNTQLKTRFISYRLAVSQLSGAILRNLPGKAAGAIALTSLLISGCAQQPSQTDSILQSRQTDLPSVEYKEGELNRETLYDLIIAELAGQEEQYELSLANYIRQSRLTKDPAIAKRATYIAKYINKPQRMLEAAMLWQEAETDNAEPYQIAASILLQQGDFDRALPLLNKALDHSNPQTLQMIANSAGKLSQKERQAYIDVLSKKNTTNANPTLLTTLGILYKSNNQPEPAGKAFDQAIKLSPKHHGALFQKAELLRKEGKVKEALQLLKGVVEGKQSEQQLHTLYIQLLFQDDQNEKAVKQANLLLELRRAEPQLGFYLALLMLEKDLVDDSEAVFKKILNRYPQNSTPYYYLGLIELQRENDEQALEYLTKVKDPNNLLPALSRISDLLDNANKRGKLQKIMQEARNITPERAIQIFIVEAEWLDLHDYKDAAINLLDEALQRYDEDIALLYARAMMMSPQDFKLMEQDLRKVLELDPNNSMAMNALGYTLTLYTDRYDEALELIRQALEITPDDAAVLDSMGWILYKLQRNEEALPFLKRAYEMFPDAEVAGHLIQVYFAQGQVTEAMKLLEKSQTEHPDNLFILEAAEAIGKTAAN